MDTPSTTPGQPTPMAQPAAPVQPVVAQAASPFKLATNVPGQPIGVKPVAAKAGLSGMVKLAIAAVILVAFGAGAFYAYQKSSSTDVVPPVQEAQVTPETQTPDEKSPEATSDTTTTTQPSDQSQPVTDTSTTPPTVETSTDTSTTTNTESTTDTTSTTTDTSTNTGTTTDSGTTDTAPHKIPVPKN